METEVQENAEIPLNGTETLHCEMLWNVPSPMKAFDSLTYSIEGTSQTAYTFPLATSFGILSMFGRFSLHDMDP